MDKAGHINYWISNSKRDWKRAKYCFEQKDYVFSLFCMHLCLEKVCKALWVKNNKSNIPPKIHNLIVIALLHELNNFQLEGRYPDYAGKIYKTVTAKLVDHYFKEIGKVKLWLEKAL